MIVAHGIAVGRELPIPEWMLYWGAAIVLVISFVLLGVLWKSPQLSTRTAGRPAPELLSRISLSTALRVVLGAVSVGLLVLVFVSAAVGRRIRSGTSPRPGSTSSSGSACRCSPCCSATSGAR